MLKKMKNYRYTRKEIEQKLYDSLGDVGSYNLRQWLLEEAKPSKTAMKDKVSACCNSTVLWTGGEYGVPVCGKCGKSCNFNTISQESPKQEIEPVKVMGYKSDMGYVDELCLKINQIIQHLNSLSKKVEELKQNETTR